MRYIISLLVLFSVAVGVQAQQTTGAPDDDAILQEIINSDSPYNYTALFTRYMAGDTTLTPKEYHYLYYGYAWQPTYKPLEASPARDRLLNVISQSSDSLTRGNCDKIIEYANEVMKTDPFSPSNINFLIYAYGTMGDAVGERTNYVRLQNILNTIKSSGTGIKEDSPWHVLSLAHAEDVMGNMGIEYRKPMIISRTTEFFPLAFKKDKVKGYYFDYNRAYWNRPDQIPQRQKNGWEFNGIPLKSRNSPVTGKTAGQ